MWRFQLVAIVALGGTLALAQCENERGEYVPSAETRDGTRVCDQGRYVGPTPSHPTAAEERRAARRYPECGVLWTSKCDVAASRPAQRWR